MFKNKFVIKDLELYFINFFKKIDMKSKVSFLVTFISGILIHIQLYTSSLLNPDGLWKTNQYFSGNWELSLGRWALKYFDLLKYGTVNSAINTIISIFLISISSLLISKIFNFKKYTSILITSLLIVTGPFFTDVLTSPFCSIEYSIAFLFSILPIFLIIKNPPKKSLLFLGSLLLSISLGIYQAYISVTLFLALSYLILKAFDSENINDEMKYFFKFLLMGILGLIIYYIILKINLIYFDVRMSSYSGAENVGISNIKNMIMQIPQSYISTYDYFFSDVILNNSYWNRENLNFILLLLMVIMLIRLSAGINIKKIVYIFIAIVLLPLSMGIIEIIVPERNINLLMAASMVLVYSFIISLTERLKSNNFVNIFKSIVIVVICTILYSQILMTGSTYSALERTYKQAYSTAIRVVERFEKTEGYYEGIPILFAGGVNNSYINKQNVIYYMASGNYSSYDVFFNSYDGNTNLWKIFISNNIGIDVNLCSKEDYMKITSGIEFQKMLPFPNKSSVKIIDGILVLKVVEDPPK